MKIKLARVALALLAFSTLNPQLSTALAQGTAFTYQGRLNNNGAPANGSYDLQFIVYNNNVGGSQQGPALTNSATAVSNGLFLVTLDFGAIFTGPNRWLDIAARTNGNGTFNELSPRQQITPAPYAVMANSASNLLGSLAAAQVSGTLANGNLPSSPTFSGTVTASSFSGSGAALTSLNAGNLTSGTVPLARLSGITSNQLDAATWQLATNLSGGNAASLGGLSPAAFWQLGGNTVAGGQFLGSTNNQPLELRANGQRGLRIEPNTSGAPNVIAGAPVNFVANGIVGATIGGGGATNYAGSHPTNSVTGDFGTVGGGEQNSAFQTATVGGGNQNAASGLAATVGGGFGNAANGSANTIAGGELNTANGYESTVGGGYENFATGDGSVVAGGGSLFDGVGNTASGEDSTVGGGDQNQATNAYATVPGGADNTAGGQYSFAAGDGAQALHKGTFVWADSKGGIASSTNDEFSIRSQNGVRIQADKGIHLNAADEPIIVRDWDAFAANAPGAKAGIGRWGLFMEPTMLTIGIPSNDVSPRYFQIAKYSTNGTPTQLVQVDQGGNLTAQGVITAASFTGGAISGNGSGLTSLNASQLAGGTVPDAQLAANVARTSQVWLQGGNAGVATGNNVIGTTDNQFFDIRVNNIRAMRFHLLTDAEGAYTNAPNVVGGSSVNTVSAGVVGATIAGGGGNFNDGFAQPNKVSADFGTVGGGIENTAGDDFSTVAGGWLNSASGEDATVAGGFQNFATGLASTAAGGLQCTASGDYSFVAGGAVNKAGGDDSFAGGTYAYAANNGSFVWADENFFPFSDTVSNGFFVRATGGVKFVTGIDGSGNPTAGVRVVAGDSSWSTVSDRNAKKNFAAVDGRAVLDKLAQISISQWNYKWQKDTDVPNIGPMAQDFKAAFYPGRDDKSISTLEFDGVELAAIQGLNQKLETRTQKLEAENAELKQTVTELKQIVSQLVQSKSN